MTQVVNLPTKGGVEIGTTRRRASVNARGVRHQRARPSAFFFFSLFGLEVTVWFVEKNPRGVEGMGDRVELRPRTYVSRTRTGPQHRHRGVAWLPLRHLFARYRGAVRTFMLILARQNRMGGTRARRMGVVLVEAGRWLYLPRPFPFAPLALALAHARRTIGGAPSCHRPVCGISHVT